MFEAYTCHIIQPTRTNSAAYLGFLGPDDRDESGRAARPGGAVPAGHVLISRSL